MPSTVEVAGLLLIKVTDLVELGIVMAFDRFFEFCGTLDNSSEWGSLLDPFVLTTLEQPSIETVCY